MEILFFIVFVLLCIAFFNIQGSANVDVLIEVNVFSHSYFNFGIFFNCTYENKVSIIEQVTIGLVFVNINIFYYKDKTA